MRGRVFLISQAKQKSTDRCICCPVGNMSARMAVNIFSSDSEIFLMARSEIPGSHTFNHPLSMMMMTTDIKSSFRKKRHRRIVYRVDDPRFSRRTYGRVIPAAPPPCGRFPLQGTSRATPRLADHNPACRRGSGWTPLRCLSFGPWIAGITLQKIVYPVDAGPISAVRNRLPRRLTQFRFENLSPIYTRLGIDPFSLEGL